MWWLKEIEPNMCLLIARETIRDALELDSNLMNVCFNIGIEYN